MPQKVAKVSSYETAAAAEAFYGYIILNALLVTTSFKESWSLELAITASGVASSSTLTAVTSAVDGEANLGETLAFGATLG